MSMRREKNIPVNILRKEIYGEGLIMSILYVIIFIFIHPYDFSVIFSNVVCTELLKLDVKAKQDEDSVPHKADVRCVR